MRAKKKKKRKTIKLSQLQRMAFRNSPKMPQVVNHDGVRKEWVGIGWIDCGPATGREVKVIEDEGST